MTVDRAVPLVAGYRDFTKIGSGGFATVYRATREAFGQTVAVKFVDLDGAPESVQMRFDRECRALGALAHHPHIVTVYDAGVAESGSPYLVMEYLPQGSLDRTGRMDVPDALRLGVQLAGALETAHRAEILHRDVKPANVLRSRYGDPVLADFGIARLAGGSRTTSGVVTASVAYAPPEVLEGKLPTAASDVWSLAATLVCLLSGRTPFALEAGDGGVPALIARIVRDELPDLVALGIPADVVAPLLQALTADPARRTSSALEFGRALREVQRTRGDQVTELLVEGVESEDGVSASAVSTSVPPHPRSPTTISGPARPVVHAPTPLDTVPFAAPTAAPTPGRFRAWLRPVLVGSSLVAVSLLFGIAVLSGLAGTSNPDTSPTPLDDAGVPSSPVRSPAASPQPPPPAGFSDAEAGTWTGRLVSTDDGSEMGIDVSITLPRGSVTGQKKDKFYLAGGDICTSRVQLVNRSASGALVFTDEPYDPEAACIGIPFTLAPSGNALVYTHDAPAAPGNFTTGILTRKTSS